MGQPVYGTSAARTAGSFGEGIEFVETDTGNAYLSLGGGDWKQTKASGAALVIDPAKIPASTETRNILAVGSATATDRVDVGAATPTAADGSDLVLFDTFGNTPKKLLAHSGASANADNFLGWVLAVNYNNAVSAATAINDAFDTGIAKVAATPVQLDSDSGLIYVHPNGSVFNALDVEITSIYAAPLVPTTTTAAGSMLMQLVLRP